MRFLGGGLAGWAIAGWAAAGCGLTVQSPDLFEVTRTGGRGRLAIVVGDGGTARCNGGAARPLGDPLLLSARAIVTKLADDVKAGLDARRPPAGVYAYAVRFPDGTVRFSDTAAAAHPELGPVEEFTLQVERQVCRRR